MPRKGTVTALLATTYQWFRMLEERKEICAIFFDYRKAFDTVPHKLLLDKLCQFGINEKIILWVANYLTNRQQNVVLNGVMSDSVDVLSGVPQGSVLSPLLFIIYVNDLASLSFSGNSQIVLYADDLVLYRPISTPNEYHILQNDINTIENWTLSNCLQFNILKCKYMVIYRRRNPEKHNPLLLLNGEPIERVETFKYLGILLSTDLSWSRHIDSVCSRAKRILGLLYRQYYNHVGSEVIKQLYISLVRPHLEYACTVWDPHTRKDKESLERVQKFACRLATKRWDAGCNELYDLLNLPSLAHRRTHLKLCQLYKIIYGLCYFPEDIFTNRSNSICRSVNPKALLQPFARTNSYYYSFVPHTINLWNSLGVDQVTAVSLSSFKVPT